MSGDNGQATRWTGWHRDTPRQRWRKVCEVGTPAAVWEAMARLAGGDKLALPSTEDPNARRARKPPASAPPPAEGEG